MMIKWCGHAGGEGAGWDVVSNGWIEWETGWGRRSFVSTGTPRSQ